MKEVRVHPCANGVQCEAVYDESDDTIIILQNGMTIGYIQATPVVRMSWKQIPFTYNFRCPSCKTAVDMKYPYCPGCGAKMDGEKHDKLP